MLQELTRRLVEGVAPAAEDFDRAAETIMAGEAPPALIGAFLAALEIRGVGARELAAFARVLRSQAEPFRRPDGTVLDTCGTGGDHSGSFNISTAAAFIAAGAGVRVAKHGNRSMTSKCGSADVLTALGVAVDAETSVMEHALAEAGICFLFAQHYHTSMRHVAPVRRDLAFRTIFNRLGPLSNPAGATHQLLGVFAADLARTMAEVLRELGSQRALIVHGTDGLDEVTTTAPTLVCELNGGNIREYEVTPEDFGLRRTQRAELAGGTPDENAAIILGVLEGRPGAPLDVALLNAGAAIYAAGQAESIGAGLEQARASVHSGAARTKLEQLKSITGGGLS
jgi:anthranilate phosphoribosyltransferase